MHIVSDLTIQEDTVVTIQDVSVRYRVPRESVSGLKEFAIRLLQRRAGFEDFWALRDISFAVQQGEVFGIIGSNGSGKSTLLKVISRVLHPINGRVVVRGQIAPLLELGAGFHNELTGMENIYLNGALLGHSRKEINELIPGIIEFSEIGDFINAPIRTYSTGMVARLGFSVATCTRPDVLLVDEVLSVGDARFASKCLDRMYAYQEQGTTIIIVSHSMSTIETFCDRGLWIEHGHQRALGDAAEVVGLYMEEAAPADAEAPVYSLPGSTEAEAWKNDFKSLELEGIYATQDIFDPRQGTLSAWIKFPEDQSAPTCAVFHTDDSRYILYLSSTAAGTLGQIKPVIIARAGGNQRALDTFYGQNLFPEVSAPVNTPNGHPGLKLKKNEWHMVTMVWRGLPEGELQLFVNGQLIGARQYHPRYDDGRPRATELAAGLRPQSWSGEFIKDESGAITDARPESTLAVQDSGMGVEDIRLYRIALHVNDILKLYFFTNPNNQPE